MEQKPSVGRIVHYQSYGSPGGEHPSVPRAAIVTQASQSGDSTDVGLCVLNPHGIFFQESVPYSADGLPGTWRWPPRV